MRKVQTTRCAALLSIGVAATLTLGACNRDGASQNGAYVAGSTESSEPTGSQPLPPSNEYQAVADTPPPPLPVYDQPPIPGPGYVWTPGYWAWSDEAGDYYWAPGTWVEPPDAGLYWTPGYWRFHGGRYLFSDGYWAPQVGFYGGVDYGHGYGGSGYVGGRWQGDAFYYNIQANNLGSRRIGAVYSQGVSSNASRVSFNGGPGGLRVAPAQAEIAAAQARRVPPTAGQREQVRMASAQPQLRASVNGGRPSIAATVRPGAFTGAGVVSADEAAAGHPPPIAATVQPRQDRPEPRQPGPQPLAPSRPPPQNRPQPQARSQQQQPSPQPQAPLPPQARPELQQARPQTPAPLPPQLQAHPQPQQPRPQPQAQPQPPPQARPQQQQAKPRPQAPSQPHQAGPRKPDQSDNGR
jgi:hypothetical protein